MKWESHYLPTCCESETGAEIILSLNYNINLLILHLEASKVEKLELYDEIQLMLSKLNEISLVNTSGELLQCKYDYNKCV